MITPDTKDVRDSEDIQQKARDNDNNNVMEHDRSPQATKEAVRPISKTDMLQVRRWMVGMVEELKMKRKSLIEAESKAEALAEQLHSLQMEKDSELQEAKKRETQLQSSLAKMKQQHEDKLKTTDVEKLRRQVQRESNTYVQDKIKEELRQLKTILHQKEKQARELETQLQTEKATSSKLLTQWKDVEEKFEDLSQLYQACQQSLARLEEGARTVKARTMSPRARAQRL